MSRSNKSVAALLAIFTGAYVGVASADTHGADRSRPHVQRPSGVSRSDGLARNPNNCAPGQPRAVWAPGNATGAPVGYSCYNNSNGS
jgi:hypothetical protein